MGQDRAFDLLRGLFDPGDAGWWTAYGLLVFTALARKVARGRDEEVRYWLTVYEHLRRQLGTCEKMGVILWDHDASIVLRGGTDSSRPTSDVTFVRTLEDFGCIGHTEPGGYITTLEKLLLPGRAAFIADGWRGRWPGLPSREGVR